MLDIKEQVYLTILCMKMQQNGGPVDEEGYPQGTWLWHRMCELGYYTHRENKRTWRVLKRIMDGPMMK